MSIAESGVALSGSSMIWIDKAREIVDNINSSHNTNNRHAFIIFWDSSYNNTVKYATIAKTNALNDWNIFCICHQQCNLEHSCFIKNSQVYNGYGEIESFEAGAVINIISCTFDLYPMTTFYTHNSGLIYIYNTYAPGSTKSGNIYDSLMPTQKFELKIDHFFYYRNIIDDPKVQASFKLLCPTEYDPLFLHRASMQLFMVPMYCP